MAKVLVHKPTAPPPVAQQSTAKMKNLRESRPGVLANQKQHAELVLSAIVDRLGTDYGVIKSMIGHKVTSGPAEPAVIDQLAASSDWVLVGSAD